MKKIFFVSLIFIASLSGFASQIVIPMDNTQKNHLKAYGIAYWVLKHDVELYWLLNYRGGSFMFRADKTFTDECNIRGVTYEVQTSSFHLSKRGFYP